MTSSHCLVQGIAWTCSHFAKDLCGLHDPGQLTTLLHKRLDEHDKLTASVDSDPPILPSLHDQCIACFAEWLQTEHAKLSEADFLAVTGRTSAVLALVKQLPASLATADLGEQTAPCILSAAGLEPGTATSKCLRMSGCMLLHTPKKLVTVQLH